MLFLQAFASPLMTLIWIENRKFKKKVFHLVDGFSCLELWRSSYGAIQNLLDCPHSKKKDMHIDYFVLISHFDLVEWYHVIAKVIASVTFKCTWQSLHALTLLKYCRKIIFSISTLVMYSYWHTYYYLV